MGNSPNLGPPTTVGEETFPCFSSRFLGWCGNCHKTDEQEKNKFHMYIIPKDMGPRDGQAIEAYMPLRMKEKGVRIGDQRGRR